MAEAHKDRSGIILVTAFVLTVTLASAAGVFFATYEKPEDNGGLIQYDKSAVAFDSDTSGESIINDGQMALRYKRMAYSSDGRNFICEIGNSSANKYDMYINIYKDPECTEQVLLTGLIPPGSGITEFESEITLAPGTYSSTLVLTQVEDDHSTFHAQLMVALDLYVE